MTASASGEALWTYGCCGNVLRAAVCSVCPLSSLCIFHWHEAGDASSKTADYIVSH